MTDTRTRLLELAAWHQHERRECYQQGLRSNMHGWGRTTTSFQVTARYHHDASVTLVEAAEYLLKTVLERRAQACKRAGVTMDAAMTEYCAYRFELGEES